MDDRPDSVQNTSPVVADDIVSDATLQFGLGTTTASVKLGSYAMRFNNNSATTIVDGVPSAVADYLG